MAMLYILLVMVMTIGLFAPSAASQHCEVTGCWTECHAVPGGRRCRNVCRRRCWHPPPPRYTAPQSAPSYRYSPPAYTAAAPSPTDLAPLLLIVVSIALVVLIMSTASSSVPAVDEDVRGTEALTKKLEEAAREADERIALFLKNAGADDGGRNG